VPVPEGRPDWSAVRPGDTQPMRIRPRPAARDDGPGWSVSGDPGTFVPLQEPDHRFDD
jgi:hypothetical protein